MEGGAMSSAPFAKEEEKDVMFVSPTWAFNPKKTAYMWNIMNYKQLQFLAKIHGVPCNLKKDIMKTILKAKVEGRHEEAEFLLLQVKEARLERRRLKRVYLSSRQPDERINIGRKEEDESNKATDAREILTKMMKTKRSRNLTICKTQMHAHYQTHSNPAASLSYEHRLTNSIAGHYNTDPLGHRSYLTNSTASITAGPSSISTMDLPLSVNFSHPGSLSYPYNHLQSKLSYQTKTISTVHMDSFTNSPRRISYFSTQPMRTFMSIDEVLGTRPPSDLPHLVSSPSESSYDTVSSHSNIAYKAKLPPFESMIRPKIFQGEPSTESQSIEPLQIDSTALDCLASTAMSMSQQVQDKKSIFDRLLLVPPQNNYPSQGNELILGSFKSTSQDVPTWNNFLEQLSTNNEPEVQVNCKFGCHVPMKTKEEQIDHEIHCFYQPIRCPKPECSWHNILGGLGTHIFNYHDLEVIASSEATFTLNIARHDESYANAQFKEGPTRFCYLQLLNRRLFIITAIVDYQNMQTFVYVQFLNDSNNWQSTAAFEVVRPDGTPYQWTGPVFPLSYNPMHLITRRQCLIINLNMSEAALNVYILHSKIQNHDPY